MAFDRSRMLLELERELRRDRDSLIKKLYEYFSCAGISKSFRDRLNFEALLARGSEEFEDDICNRFEEWLGTSEAGTLPYVQFRALTHPNFANSHEFLFLCYCLYKDQFRQHQDRLIVESSDGEVFEIDKRVAAAGSDYFAGHLRFEPENQRIVLPTIRSHVLSWILDYLWMSDDFREVPESAVRPFKGWVTEHLKNHEAILDELHTAADYLGIRSLCDLTRQALGYLRGRNARGELTRWCENLSLSRVLHSLVVGA